ncbi:MAG: hypothetical protein K9H16_05865 [Bacteroidales bacterium]|nr:hypothetical protein [Bacteroidales bacterium]
MVKSAVLFSLIFLHSYGIWAQENFYDFVKPGELQVGFLDTLLFDTAYHYEAFDYKGMKPYFVQIWHPINKIPLQNYLTFNDFFESGWNEDLSTIQNQLMINYKEAIIRDCIEENLESGESNDYGSYSYDDIVDLIGVIETKSSFAPLDVPSQYPVILYHHGAQSNSFENFVMAEYFASRGFIFVAANFHLPYENTIFGLKPFEKLIKNEDEESLRTLLEFAQTLSNSSFIFFIGHSWGAQMGLRTFDRDTAIKGLISLETTIEFKTDYEKIKEMWPEVFQKVITDNTYYPFPVLFCAATGQEKPFEFFNNINAQQITFAPTNEEFEHNAYTSTFYLRYFIDSKVTQTDKEILKNRLPLYARHLVLINEFIEGIIKNEKKQEKEIIFVR